MSVYLITRTTSRVEHVGVFAYDRDTPGSWDTGRHVPLCGRERIHQMWTIVDWPTRTTASPARHRKRLCDDCRRRIVQIRSMISALDVVTLGYVDDELPLGQG